MTAKEYLTQALAIERLIAAKRRLLKKLQLQSVSLSASVSPDKVMSSNHRNMAAVDKIVDLEKEIACQEQTLIDKQKEIINRIQVVYNPTLIAVLTDKYVNGISLADIAVAMNKSVRTISVWHGQALQIFRQETGLK